MPILDHIEELRQRIIKVIIAVGVLSFLFFMCEVRFAKIGDIPVPYLFPNVYHNLAASIIDILRQQVLPANVKIIVTNPSEALVSEVWIAIFLGVVFGMPIIAYEFWAYVSPALYENEKMLLVKLTAPATILFAVGSLFGYIFIVPYAFEFLYAYAATIGIITYITINDFITFILLFCVAMGITFELPLIMIGLTKLGIVKPESWKKNLRYFVAFSVVYGAFITPDGSGVTMWFVALPMIALYGLGYFISRKTVK